MTPSLAPGLQSGILEEPIDRIELTVHAEAFDVVHQQYLVVTDLREKPAVPKLTDLPLEALYIDGKNRIRASYDAVRTTVHKVVCGREVVAQEIHLDPRTPSFTLQMNSENEKRWGSWWNLDAYRDAKARLREKISAYLLNPFEYADLLTARRGHTVSQRARSMLARMLTASLPLGFLLWIRLVLKLERL